MASWGVGGLIHDDGSSRIRNWEFLLGLRENVHGDFHRGVHGKVLTRDSCVRTLDSFQRGVRSLLGRVPSGLLTVSLRA